MRIIVVGAGLSGLSLATFLRRLNIDVVVVEQTPFLQSQYIPPYTLYANALSCYKSFGMDYIFTNAGVEPEESFGIMNPSFKWLMKIKNKNVHMRSLGAEDVVPISTAPLANSNSIVSQRLAEEKKLDLGYVPFRSTVTASYLRGALRRHIPEIKFGSTVVDLVPHDGIKGGVHVILDDGSSEWGDAVVGADGMHSVVRKLLYSGEYVGRSNRSLGNMQIDGFVDVKHNIEGLESPVEMWGKKKSIALVPHFKHGENRIAFSATIGQRADALSDMGESEDVLAIFRGLLKEEFSEFGNNLGEVLGKADLAIPTDVIEVPVMPRWYNKRAVLIGDAAHGSLPSFLQQDASLCVEDAALLATAFTDIPLMRDSGFEYVFKQFETVRRSRVERYIRQSRRARAFAMTPYTQARDLTLMLTPPPLINLTQRWLSGWSYSSQALEVDPKIKMETAFR